MNAATCGADGGPVSAERTCTVWSAEPAPSETFRMEVLDHHERSRQLGFRVSADRDRFTTAAVLLRAAVAATTGRPPADVHIDRSCRSCGQQHGRPTAPGIGLFLSVSHSHRLIAVAITTAAPVGIDVEWVDPRWTLAGSAELARLVLAADERANTATDFFAYWTRKEAAVKATGDGMQVPLSEVRVTAPDEPAGLRSYPGHPRLGMQMMDLHLGRSYAAAVALRTTVPPTIEYRSAGELGIAGLH